MKNNKLKIDEELILVERAREGDDQAFAELVKRYENLVYSFAFKVCRDADKARETWQDTFINIYRKLHQFNGKSKFSTWIYSIVANNCRMLRRKNKLEIATINLEEKTGQNNKQDVAVDRMEILKSQHSTPLDAVLSDELRIRLDEAIKKLPHNYRIVFVLRDIEGLSAEETAKILHLTVPSVKSRLRRARVFLRSQLVDYLDR